jgi:hypothetical protein
MTKTKSVISRRRFVQSGVAGSVALSTLGKEAPTLVGGACGNSTTDK